MPTLTRRSVLLMAAPIAVAVAVAGCTGAQPPVTGGPGTTRTPGGAAAGGPALSGATPVAITMNEWSVAPSTATAPAGEVTFTANNVGKQTHELVLFKTDLAIDKLPLDDEGAVDERAAGVELIDEVEDVEAGASKSFTAELKPGKYWLVCNLVDQGDKHFGHKMYAPFTVT